MRKEYIRYSIKLKLVLILGISFIIGACADKTSKETVKLVDHKMTNAVIPKGPYRRLEPEFDGNGLKLPAAPLVGVLDPEGDLFTLNTLSKAKYALLVFTDRDCSHCEAFYPELQLFSQKNDSIECVVVQINSTAKDIKAFKSSNGYRFKMLEGNLDVFERYEVDSTPNSFLLDKANNIVNIGTPTTADEIDEFIVLRNKETDVEGLE